MMRKTMAMVLALTMICSATACSKAAETPKPETTAPADSAAPSEAKSAEPEKSNKVVVYTAAPTNLYEAAIEGFVAKTGITVEIISAGTGELTKRIQAEAGNPLGDVMWGGRSTALSSILDNLEEYTSPNDEAVYDAYKNANNNKKLTPFTIQVNSIFVNKDLAGDIVIDGYGSLTNPALKGKISFADPAKSSSSTESLVNILFAMGKGDPEKGWEFVKEFIANLDGKIQGSSSAAYKNVADGEYTVGLTNESNGITYKLSGANVEVVYAKEGVIIKTDNVALIKGCKNSENAKLFIDYITSLEFQSKLEKMSMRSVRKDVKLNTMLPLEQIPTAKEDSEWVAAQGTGIKDKFADLFTS
ncbi:extracellular solute-binding protein [Oscillospiraceae bacterium PP1C4]